MFERLGKRAIAVPLVLVVVLGCMFSIMFYPMANMEIKELPFAIVSLDKGVKTDEGKVNLGELVAENMIDSAEDSDGEASPMKWTQLSSQEELDAAIERGEYYGAIVIPEDFSKSQYKTIKATMKKQVKKMTPSMQSMMASNASSMSDTASGMSGLDMPSMSSSDSASGTLTSEQKETVAGAKKGADALKKSLKILKATAKATKAQSKAAQKEVKSAAAALAADQKTLASQTAELKELTETANPTEEQAKRISELMASTAALQTKIEARAKQVQALTAAAKQKAILAAQAQGNLKAGQANAKVAAANASGVEKTMTAGVALKTRATALASAAGSMKSAVEKIKSSVSAGTTQIDDEKIDEIADAAAAKALKQAEDQIKEGTSSEDDEEDEGGSLTVYLDYGKSPMIANSMKSSVGTMFAEQGMTANIEMLHDGKDAGEGDEEGSMANPMGTLMGLNVSIMPLAMLSVVGGLMLTRIFRRDKAHGAKGRAAVLGKQLVYAVVFTLAVAVVDYCMLTFIGGIEAEAGLIIPFTWLCSFCVLIAVMGLGNISFPLGALFGICAIAFGMSTGLLPYEAIPVFWQEWIYPWVPQRFVGEGLRSILYLGGGVINSGTSALLIYCAVGAVLMLLSVFIPGGLPGKMKERLQERKHASA